jgi:transposase
MAKALSVDLRERVIAAVESGVSGRQVALRFEVSPSSVSRWRGKLVQEGEIAPKRQGGDRRSGRIEAYAELILNTVTAAPDITLAELQAMLKDEGLTVGIGSIWRFFDRRKITLKKRPRTPRNSDAGR